MKPNDRRALPNKHTQDLADAVHAADKRVRKLRRALGRILRAATALEYERLGEGAIDDLNAAKASYNAAVDHAHRILKDMK